MASSQSQTRAEATTTITVRAKLSELRKACEKDIEIHRQKLDSVSNSFAKFLQSNRSESKITSLNQVKLGKLKVELRESEADLVRALAVKTRKEAKRLAITDSLSETIVKVDELQKIVKDQTARKDDYAAILSEQSKAIAASEENNQEAFKNREEIQKAFVWYNRILGFHIDGGHGVTFTFTNINKKCPAEEYSFTIRHANEKYTLLDCKPHLNEIEELVHELNKSNGLFRFVRIMREKFQAASAGTISRLIYQDQDCTSLSLSAPVSSISIDSRSSSPLPLREVNRDIRKLDHGRGAKSPHLFSPTRQSPRLLAKKPREG